MTASPASAHPIHPVREWSSSLEWILFLALALTIAFALRVFVFQPFSIPSASMAPTLEVGDRILVDKVAYRIRDVHRGDIVVLKAPTEAETSEVHDLVKRVIGLPGDRIEGRYGDIYVNNRRLEEPWLPEVKSSDFTCSDALGCRNGRVPPNQVFVLGDNRLASKDSTYFGPVPESSLVGRVSARVWPIDRLGFLGPSYMVELVAAAATVLTIWAVLAVRQRRRYRH